MSFDSGNGSSGCAETSSAEPTQVDLGGVLARLDVIADGVVSMRASMNRRFKMIEADIASLRTYVIRLGPRVQHLEDDALARPTPVPDSDSTPTLNLTPLPTPVER
jgi:hypothetical protein